MNPSESSLEEARQIISSYYQTERFEKSIAEVIEKYKQEIERLKIDPQERPLFLKEIESLKSKLKVAREALTNISRYMEEIAGAEGVKTSSTWNIAIKALKQIGEGGEDV